MDELPYLTTGEPLRGVYKARWEDFMVAEVQAVEPEGRGDHTWMEVEKQGLTTVKAAADLAGGLGVRTSSIGYAGMKDARAITRQWMSVEHVTPARALALDIPRIRVLQAARHPRKLRRGWHGGNRFMVKLRPPGHAWDSGDAATEATVAGVLESLLRRGVPNYYGPQRFGYRGDTWRVGRALARAEWQDAVSLIAGRPLRAGDPEVDPAGGVHADADDILRARERFDEGRYAEAATSWPSGFAQCARVAAAMHRTGGDAERSVRVVGKPMLRMYASAYQAWLFNQVLARRACAPDLIMPGDLAWKHDTESLFHVEDIAATQERAWTFQVSPTGPLVGTGRRGRKPEAAVAHLEADALLDAGFQPGELDSRVLAPLAARRRPLRFPLNDATTARGNDTLGPFIELRFRLPPGCYATAVLREIGKGGIVEGR